MGSFRNFALLGGGLLTRQLPIFSSPYANLSEHTRSEANRNEAERTSRGRRGRAPDVAPVTDSFWARSTAATVAGSERALARAARCCSWRPARRRSHAAVAAPAREGWKDGAKDTGQHAHTLALSCNRRNYHLKGSPRWSSGRRGAHFSPSCRYRPGRPSLTQPHRPRRAAGASRHCHLVKACAVHLAP